jgi:hypothetical protein
MTRFLIPIRNGSPDSGEPFMANGTEPYPDQAGMYMKVDGNGLSIMSALYLNLYLRSDSV